MPPSSGSRPRSWRSCGTHSRHAIIAALAGSHPRDDIRRTLMRLAVLERLIEQGVHPAAGSRAGLSHGWPCRRASPILAWKCHRPARAPRRPRARVSFRCRLTHARLQGAAERPQLRRVAAPCLRAFRLPSGAPLPTAPSCIRQRRLLLDLGQVRLVARAVLPRPGELGGVHCSCFGEAAAADLGLVFPEPDPRGPGGRWRAVRRGPSCCLWLFDLRARLR
jgi:hypothetical protein